MYMYVIVILHLPGVYTEYTPGRYWVAYLSHRQLLMYGRLCAELVVLFIECEWYM